MRQDNTENKTRVGSVIKFGTIAICLGMFACNSFVVFKQYIGGNTVITNDIEIYSKMQLPSITICGTRGFKEELLNYSYVEKERYFSNTFELNELIYVIRDNEVKNYTTPEELLDGQQDNPEIWINKVTLSAYRGRCYTFEYQKEVKARESVMIAINETSEFWLYLHAKGEEYFLHYDFWPYVPFAHHFKDTEYWVDINVRKKVLNGVIHKTDTSADTISNTSDYFGCLTKTFRRETKIKKLSCTLPWIESMLKNPDNNTIIKKSPCSNNDSFEETNDFGKTFAKEISKFGSKYDCQCPEPFRKITYNGWTQVFDKWSVPRMNAPNWPFRMIAIYYPATIVDVSTSSELFSFSSFVSSIGGNLGLFVGFSFISTILFIFKVIEKFNYDLDSSLW